MMIETNTLAELAVKHPAASRVLHRHGLDFCCHGNRPLESACEERGLSPAAVLEEIEIEDGTYGEVPHWENRPIQELISHLVNHYHFRLREELPLLVQMADKVERAHHDKPTMPHGLRDRLESEQSSILDHLQKEEKVLFPMIAAGRGTLAAGPIHTVEIEHQDHAQYLKQMRTLTSNFVAPADACPTWQALYIRLADFESELMNHIHLENNVLFRRALCG